jgi:hypothetical protein
MKAIIIGNALIAVGILVWLGFNAILGIIIVIFGIIYVFNYFK